MSLSLDDHSYSRKNRSMETEEKEEDATFSYNLLFRSKYAKYKWSVFEKGSEKSNLNNKFNISYDKIKSAFSQIEEHIQITPCIQKHFIDLESEHFNIFLKEEFRQVTNSVKARGVVYSLLQLSDAQKRKGVIAISSRGSFAHSLCYFGMKFGIPVTVVMPMSTDQCQSMLSEKAVMFRSLGAEVLFHTGIRNITEAHTEALRIAKERGLVYIDGNDHPNMIVGQSTLAIEILKCMTNVDAVILPTMISRCGLTEGLAMTIKGWNSDIKVIKVRPRQYDPSIELIRKKTMDYHELDIPITIYDLDYDIRQIGTKSWIDETVIVTNNYIDRAINLLTVPDFTANVGLAAILFHKLDELKGKRVVIIAFGKMDIAEAKMDNLNLCGAGPSNKVKYKTDKF